VGVEAALGRPPRRARASPARMRRCARGRAARTSAGGGRDTRRGGEAHCEVVDGCASQSFVGRRKRAEVLRSRGSARRPGLRRHAHCSQIRSRGRLNPRRNATATIRPDVDFDRDRPVAAAGRSWPVGLGIRRSAGRRHQVLVARPSGRRPPRGLRHHRGQDLVARSCSIHRATGRVAASRRPKSSAIAVPTSQQDRSPPRPGGGHARLREAIRAGAPTSPGAPAKGCASRRPNKRADQRRQHEGSSSSRP